MRRLVRDPLYGHVDHGPPRGGRPPAPSTAHARRLDLAWELYQTEALARLRDVSLSSVPTRMLPTGSAASRFEHSFGVGELARRLALHTGLADEEADHLMAAALLHDVGSPPFSHVSELFLQARTGLDHEQAALRLLAPGGEVERVCEIYGVHLSRVHALIMGRGRLGPILAGTIDLDNLDNSSRLLRSLGQVREPPYRPERLVHAFVLEPTLALDAAYLPELLLWRRTRAMLYDDVLYDPVMLSSAAMLYRALECADATGALTADFFSLTDGPALQHLRSVDARARVIVDRAAQWRQYLPVARCDDEERIRPLLGSVATRRVVSERLVAALGVDAADLAVYAGSTRGERAIDLPLRDAEGDHTPSVLGARPGRARVWVFTHRGIGRLHAQAALEEVLDGIEPSEASPGFL